jgi:hypothetical protein
LIATATPRAASARTLAAPMPRAPPVTRATWLVHEFIAKLLSKEESSFCEQKEAKNFIRWHPAPPGSTGAKW